MFLARLFQVGETTAGSVDFTVLLDALKNSITPAQVLGVLAAVIGVGMVFFLMWLGVRKAITAFTSSLAKGKLRI